MIYEERHIRIAHGRIQEFLEETWRTTSLNLEKRGATPLCLLSTIVGGPPEEMLLVSGYQDFGHWLQVQHELTLREVGDAESGLVKEITVNLLQASTARPELPIKAEDRRPVYGVRRFQIDPLDWERFIDLSLVLWGAWEPALDSVILGLFRSYSRPYPQEVVLFTGYRGVAHWEETRKFLRSGRPEGFGVEEWSKIEAAHRARNIEIPLSAGVKLMRAHWMDD